MQLLLPFVVCLAVVGNCLALNIPDHAYTQRAPSYPLAVRTPYASIWLPANTLPGNWPTFWQGTTKGWLGIVRVDGVSYEWMGAADRQGDGAPVRNVAAQKQAIVTPTQTHFLLTAGPVDLNVTFFSPVEYEDVQRQSIPLSHVLVTVGPNDGKTHEVQLYMDISAEWASSDLKAPVRWSFDSSANSSAGIVGWSTELVTQYKFGEYNDHAQWGQAVLLTSQDASYQSGADLDVRSLFVANGQLNNVNDDNFRCASCDWPVMAFSHNLGVTGEAKTVRYAVGHLREENINLLQQAQKALWAHYWPNRADMFAFFWNDLEGSLQRANALDVKLLNEAFETEGQEYANIVTMSLRQSYGATEFSGNISYPILYLKEISSNGNMQTVDVMYPATPLYYHLNIKYLRYLLRPLFYQMENQYWPQTFSIHDIGHHFPNATGHADLVGHEDMPVEESANMLLMVAQIAFHPDANRTESVDYVRRHFPILTQWADYLYNNCLYPVNQLTTDDFIGPTQLNSGLALKGILGMKAYAKLAQLIGETETGDYYDNAVAAFIQIWEVESTDPSGTHLKMEYNATGGYQFKYNAYFDKLFNFGVVPERIYELEASYYLTLEEPYGIPFCDWHDYTKSDWEVWTAAAFGDASPALRKSLVKSLSQYLRFTASRVPFSDWYVTATANSVAFLARPVVGGHFALLALNNRANP